MGLKFTEFDWLFMTFSVLEETRIVYLLEWLGSWLDDLEWMPDGGKYFFFFFKMSWLAVVPPAICYMWTVGSLPGGKWSGCDGNLSCPSSVEVKNDQNGTSDLSLFFTHLLRTWIKTIPW
jgi:hypothetical protein